MAVAALALQQHLLYLSKPTTWLPNRTHLKSQRIGRVSLVSCSSSSSSSSSPSSSPEATTETAESCVNLGLSLFSKGRARLGGEDIGYSFRRDLKLISEVQAPFRGVRRFFYFAFTAGAGIGTFFTVPRLFRALKGGDGAPGLWETAGNAAINIVGKYFFSFWDGGWW
uniref:Uncharacterized protein n=1 Tax=Nelumbo nucifera TaxID=4432 RepID=A0A822YPR1_NELNU|nr:TPA_asm: hypothetical protein HUJ06_012180 [Nelumbo nucifera]